MTNLFMIKVYVSGSYSEQARLRARASNLTKLGYHVTSTWLQEVQKPDYLSLEEWEYNLALKDISDLAAADCIILDLDGTSTTGGRYVEWGFALGRFNMLKLIVGNHSPNMFGRLADRAFKDWDALFRYLKEEHPIDSRMDSSTSCAGKASA